MPYHINRLNPETPCSTGILQLYTPSPQDCCCCCCCWWWWWAGTMSCNHKVNFACVSTAERISAGAWLVP
jgi:hypothetical protein